MSFTATGDASERKAILAGRAEREMPSLGNNTAVPALVRKAITEDRLGEAEATLDVARSADLGTGELIVFESMPIVESRLKEGGMELTDDMRTVLAIVGPHLVVEGLYHARSEAASELTVNELQTDKE